MSSEDLTAYRHDHTFGQDQKRAGEVRTLVVTVVTALMMVWEILAGVLYGSMALLADGLHMGSHAAALAISVFAYWYARRHARNRQFTFGTGKVNALGGFTGAVLLLVFALIMAVESVGRFLYPIPIAFNQAIFVAVIGLVVNGVCAWILDHTPDHDHHHGHDHHHHHDHNLRSAYLHVLADALTSLLAIAALFAAKYYGLLWMDPVMGIVGAVLVTRWSWGLLRDTSGVLLDRQAGRVLERVRKSIEQDEGTQITDLHVWAVGSEVFAAEIGVVTTEPRGPSHYKSLIPPELGVAHVTVEVHCMDTSSH